MVFTEVGRNPPGIPYLLEERHDILDGGVERAGWIFAGLDHITALLGMQVEDRQPTSRILVDQLARWQPPQALEAGPVTYDGTVPMFLSQVVTSADAERTPGSDLAWSGVL